MRIDEVISISKRKRNTVNETVFSDTTGIDEYDRMHNDPSYASQCGFSTNVIQMTPAEYVRCCAEGKGSSILDTVDDRIGTGKVSKYAMLMASGEKSPMPLLLYGLDEFQQEGLHRALAAQELGYTTVPVLVVTEIE